MPNASSALPTVVLWPSRPSPKRLESGLRGASSLSRNSWERSTRMRSRTTMEALWPSSDWPHRCVMLSGTVSPHLTYLQDYHRFHSPVDGVIGPMTLIPGEYYTVNVSTPLFWLHDNGLMMLLKPQAIRGAIDVYAENVRKIVPIDTPDFGRVFNVCIGAMMVGSIATTLNEGDHVARGQEFGYFAFGKLPLSRSTNLLLTRPQVVRQSSLSLKRDPWSGTRTC